MSIWPGTRTFRGIVSTKRTCAACRWWRHGWRHANWQWTPLINGDVTSGSSSISRCGGGECTVRCLQRCSCTERVRFYRGLVVRTPRLHTTEHERGTWAITSTRWHFAFALCCHSNETRAAIANPPNSAQLGRTPYHSPKSSGSVQ